MKMKNLKVSKLQTSIQYVFNEIRQFLLSVVSRVVIYSYLPERCLISLLCTQRKKLLVSTSPFNG